jgi:hypothetical protein
VKRVYHHFERWEEITAGMWRNVPVGERQAYIDNAAALMKDPQAFFLAMHKATIEWPHSCEHHLTGTFNRQAWIGHAGCCIATGSPEDLTRLAWHTLTQSQQDAANLAADKAIAEWERRYTMKGGVCQSEG